ncbi:MAG: DUF4350 domain-containing protein [Pyrinomonadaceae bacterium]
MKERLVIFLALIILIILLVGLNAVSFVKREKLPDSEVSPNRSTYNTGTTGTRAFYDLLAETGRRVTRWQEPPSALLVAGKNKPNTFVVIGSLRRAFEEDEIRWLLDWVSMGGKLVVIDREPPAGLIKTTTNWTISAVPERNELPFGVEPSDQKEMTDRIIAGKPAQPTVYTININAVQPSRFASSVRFSRLSGESAPKTKAVIGEKTSSQATPVSKKTPETADDDEEYFQEDEPLAAKPTPSRQTNGKTAKDNQVIKLPPTPKPTNVPVVKVPPQTITKEDIPDEQTAPVVHLANDRKNLLVDFPYGEGKIVFLTDPYIVANSGLSLVDNAQLAVNVVASTDGLIAFDEYHQGYGGNNQLFAYFTGTPVIPIILQLVALIGLIFYSQSRRFGRALPSDEPNRLSKLEYVAAMAELQQRTKGYDLAIENIYTDFRRRAARSFSVDNFTTSRSELARLIAERLPSEDVREIDEVMRQCENIGYGEKTNKKEVLRLAGRLRELEEKLGLQRRKKRRSEK